jgi:uncharacterized protein involved in response to NO
MTIAPITTMQRSRAWRGPAVLSYGFRPFFLLAGIQAALMVGLWVAWYEGTIRVPSAFPPIAWHIHELLFGYVWAVVAGFLLTAVPNWTGRLPVVGWPLLGLVVLWLAGRFAVAFSESLSPLVVALVTLAFPLVLIAALAREIVASGNPRNLKVLFVAGLLMAAQVLFHAEAAGSGDVTYAARLAVAAVLVLIMLIGGRIVPSFTSNWLKRENPGRLPVPFNRYDALSIAIAAIALALWVALPALETFGRWIAVPLALAGFLHAVRLARWAGERTLREPLVTVLHLAYAFVPAGFVLAAWGAWTAEPDVAAIHAWTVGVIGLMTLAVMTRATRGHTGQPVTAPAGTVVIYALIATAALTRIVAAFAPDWSMTLLAASGAAWTAGFVLFILLYGPLLMSPRGAA